MRNSRRLDSLYVGPTHPLAPEMFEIADKFADADEATRRDNPREMDPETSDGMAGSLLCVGETCPAVVPAPYEGLGDDITGNAVCMAAFINPPQQVHRCCLLEGAVPDVSYVEECLRKGKCCCIGKRKCHTGPCGTLVIADPALVDALCRTSE